MNRVFDGVAFARGRSEQAAQRVAIQLGVAEDRLQRRVRSTRSVGRHDR